MSQEIIDILLPILPACVAVVVAFTSYLIVFFKSRKTKVELEQQKTELEKQKLELETLTYQGSYIICPDCKRKIYLKDMVFDVDRVSVSKS